MLFCKKLEMAALAQVLDYEGIKMAPAPGFEPGTKWLTATYSTAELCRNKQASFRGRGIKVTYQK